MQLERDRCERLGIPFVESEAIENIKKKEKRPPLEEIKHGIKTVKTLYTEDRQPGVAKTCLSNALMPEPRRISVIIMLMALYVCVIRMM